MTRLDPAVIDAPALLALVRDASNLRDAREALSEDLVAARATGHTWRELAQAVGMTEHGVANLHARTLSARS